MTPSALSGPPQTCLLEARTSLAKTPAKASREVAVGFNSRRTSSGHAATRMNKAGEWVCVGGAIFASLALTIELSSESSVFAAGLFPPWQDMGRAVEAAAGAGNIVSVLQTPLIIVVEGDPETIQARLRAAGAIYVVGSRAFGVCAASRRKE
jgi:hypothetical protein